MSFGLIGQTLGQYEIRSLLGKGGMSTVYMAYQTTMDRIVALKVLPREFLHDDTFLTRFETETRTIARLEHLHILPVYDAGEQDGLPYIVMRYLPGGTLEDLIDEKLPQLSTVIRIVSQLAGALDHAHARGIIHRDIKPSNVLLDSSRNAYLADFGIARVEEATRVTTESHVIGTPCYVAPEAVKKGEVITEAVDIYALACVTYEMLTGEPPYDDPDPTKTLMAHVMEPIPSVRDFDPNISTEVDEVVKRAMAKNPADRYVTAGGFARELAKAAESGFPTVHTSPLPAEAIPLLRPAADPASVSASAPASESATDYIPDEEDGSSIPWGCLVGVGIVIAMLAGIIITANVITEGKPFSVLAYLEPAPTNTITPTVTLTPGGDDIVTPPPSITPDIDVSFDPPILPPPSGGDRLVFASNRDGDYEIYTIDIDGSNLQKLTDNRAFDFDPDWSPDGNRIVFASNTDGDHEIKIMDADGQNTQQITDNGDRDTDPAFSPDGEWIAFASDRDGDFDLYVMRPDGSEVRQLTDNDNRDDLTPTWSPDGSRIAYYVKIGADAATTELYIIDVASGDVDRLTSNSLLDQWPDWSPDGQRLVYTAGALNGDSRRTLATYDIKTSEARFLIDAAARDDDPDWSPEGTRVAFDSDRAASGDFDLYVFDLVSGELRQITVGAGSDVAPVWQPHR